MRIEWVRKLQVGFLVGVFIVGLLGCGSGGGGGNGAGAQNLSKNSFHAPTTDVPALIADTPTVLTTTVFVPVSEAKSKASAPAQPQPTISLERLDTNDVVTANLGNFHDDGLNGDADEGDGVFSIQVTLTEQGPDPIRFRVSAIIDSSSPPTVSDVITIPVYQIPSINSSSDYNRVVDDLFVNLVNLRDAFVSLNNSLSDSNSAELDLETFTSLLQKIIDSSTSSYKNVLVLKMVETSQSPPPSLKAGIRKLSFAPGFRSAICAIPFLGGGCTILDVGDNGQEAMNLVKIVRANGADPRVPIGVRNCLLQQMSEADLSDPELEDLRGALYLQCPKGSGGFLDTLGKMAETGAKFEISQAFDPVMDTIGNLIPTSTLLGEIVVDTLIGKGAEIIIDWYVDSSGHEKMRFSKVTGIQSIDVPTGSHNLVILYGGDTAPSVVEGITVSINNTTLVSAPPGTRTIQGPSAPAPPSAPTGITATPGNGQVTISWNAGTGADSYNIYWSTTSLVTKVTGTKIENITSPYSHTGLTNGTTYYYVLTAVNANGESAESNLVSATPALLPLQVQVIATGGGHTCVLVSGGVQCWGNNFLGPLGDGTTTLRTAPVAVSGLQGVTAITAGLEHTCALLNSNSVQCWGSNFSGQLGSSGSFNPLPTPVEVIAPGGAAAITAGGGHTCALLTNGSVQCWGSNFYGQLSDGTLTSGVLAIAAGRYHTCALLIGNIVKCWGLNEFGQLGDGTFNNHAAPTVVSGLNGVTAIAAGMYHTCALLSTGGIVHCWGHNGWSQLGDGSTTHKSSAIVVNGLSGVTAIAAGGEHTCALKIGGSIQCWGNNEHGQLGDGTTTLRAIPVAVSGLGSASMISLGLDHTCTLIWNGTVKCWGANFSGQLGNGTTENSLLPTDVIGFSATPRPATRFSVIDLGDLLGGEDSSAAHAINTNGEVVGISLGVADANYGGFGGTGGATKPFLWTLAREMQELASFAHPALGRPASGTAYGINDNGVVVGCLDYGFAAKPVPFIWTASDGMQPLKVTPEGTEEFIQAGCATAINGAGEIVGSSGGGAFRWTASGGKISLGIAAQITSANAINNLGDVGGSAGIEACNTGPVIWRANGRLQGVELLPYASPDRMLCHGRITGINDNGAAVGSVGIETIPRTSPSVRAFIWFPTSGARDLGELNTINLHLHNTEARGINNREQVVGSSNGHAFLWSPEDGMRDLNNLLDESGAAGWELGTALAINNFGQIIGIGIHNGVSHAFLLTPIGASVPP